MRKYLKCWSQCREFYAQNPETGDLTGDLKN